MNDLEMTKLCAEAMGKIPVGAKKYQGIPVGVWLVCHDYDPLHDDAQAMALVKKFAINITWYEVNMPGKFEPTIYMWCRPPTDLNRAIVECVAKMQMSKSA